MINTPYKVLSTVPGAGCTPINGAWTFSPVLWLTGRVRCVVGWRVAKVETG